MSLLQSAQSCGTCYHPLLLIPIKKESSVSWTYRCTCMFSAKAWMKMILDVTQLVNRFLCFQVCDYLSIILWSRLDFHEWLDSWDMILSFLYSLYVLWNKSYFFKYLMRKYCPFLYCVLQPQLSCIQKLRWSCVCKVLLSIFFLHWSNIKKKNHL